MRGWGGGGEGGGEADKETDTPAEKLKDFYHCREVSMQFAFFSSLAIPMMT